MLLLLLLLLWGINGVEGQNPQEGFTLNVERKVVVQEGLCVLVPCNFSYLKKRWTDWTDSDPVHGFWYREGTDRRKDSIVATNNPIREAVKGTRNRFFLLGDPWRNDCSLNIREIRKKDAGLYFFRLERGKTKYNYMWDKMTLVVTGQTWSAKMPWVGGGVRDHASGQGWDRTLSWEQLGLSIRAQGRSWIRAGASSEAAPDPILMLHFSPFLTSPH